MTRRLLSMARIGIVCALLTAALIAAACAQSASRDDSLERLTIAVKNNPDLELMATDAEAKILTVRVKSADRIITVTPDDLEDGRLVIDVAGSGDTPPASRAEARPPSEPPPTPPSAQVSASETGGQADVKASAGGVSVSAGSKGKQADVKTSAGGVSVDAGGRRVDVAGGAGGVSVDAGGRRVDVAGGAGGRGGVAVTAPRAEESSPPEAEPPAPGTSDRSTPTPSPPSEGAGERIVIPDNKLQETIECTGHEVAVIGNHNELTLVGDCARVELLGNNNTVEIEAVGVIYAPGSDNQISWERGIDGAEPKIVNPGSRNVIERIGG